MKMFHQAASCCVGLACVIDVFFKDLELSQVALLILEDVVSVPVAGVAAWCWLF